MSHNELLEMVKEKFENDPALSKYVQYLDKTQISDATLSNFLTKSVDYVEKYFFWVE